MGRGSRGTGREFTVDLNFVFDWCWNVVQQNAAACSVTRAYASFPQLQVGWRKARAMKVSGVGAIVGAVVGVVARGAVVVLNLHPDQSFAMIALPSAAIGALVGGIAGATGRPIRGALVGAFLSGVVFEAFMLTCASLIGQFSPEGAGDFLNVTLKYGLEMAVAGAIGGGIGGQVGSSRDAARRGEGERRHG